MLFSGDKCQAMFAGSQCPGVLTVSPSVRVERLQLQAACTTCGRADSVECDKGETLDSYHAAQAKYDADKVKPKAKPEKK